MTQSISITPNHPLGVNFGDFSNITDLAGKEVTFTGYAPRWLGQAWPGAALFSTSSNGGAVAVNSNIVTANLTANFTAPFPVNVSGDWFLRAVTAETMQELARGALAIVPDIRPAAQVQQSGALDMVVGQQGPYVVTFDPAFASAPTYFAVSPMMPNSSGELFSASVTNITTAGGQIWLSGSPTAASSGGKIQWIASL